MLFSKTQMQFMPKDDEMSGITDWDGAELYAGEEYYLIDGDVVIKELLNEYIKRRFDVTTELRKDWKGNPVETGDNFIIVDDELVFEDEWEEYFKYQYGLEVA